MVSALAKVARFIKIEHTVFSLPFIYAGALVCCRRLPSPWELVWITGAAAGARGAAMAFNRVVDAHIDRLNPRTRGREIPSGRMSTRQGWLVALLFTTLLMFSAAQLNPLVTLLAPLLPLVFLIYPYLKRFTSLTHFYLGLCLGLGPVGAWLALTGSFSEGNVTAVLLLALAVALWVAGFDTIYSLLDYDFDRKHGLHSLAVKLGPEGALNAAALAHAPVPLLLYLSARHLGPLPLVGSAAVGVMLAYEHVLARRRDPVSINRAFFNVNAAVGAVYLASVAAARLLG